MLQLNGSARTRAAHRHDAACTGFYALSGCLSLPSFRIEAAMSSVPRSIPAVINVEAEVNYWREKHVADELKSASFGHYIPWIKFACDSLITHPKASDEEREEAFQHQYAAQIMAKLSVDDARKFVEDVWEHVYLMSQHDQNARPRLSASA